MGKATLHFQIRVGICIERIIDYLKSCHLSLRSVRWVAGHVAIIGMGETSEGTSRSAGNRSLPVVWHNTQPIVQSTECL